MRLEETKERPNEKEVLQLLKDFNLDEYGAGERVAPQNTTVDFNKYSSHFPKDIQNFSHPVH